MEEGKKYQNLEFRLNHEKGNREELGRGGGMGEGVVMKLREERGRNKT
jgi:hypothetical protein